MNKDEWGAASAVERCVRRGRRAHKVVRWAVETLERRNGAEVVMVPNKQGDTK